MGALFMMAVGFLFGMCYANGAAAKKLCPYCKEHFLK